ncbi:MAG: hypothetical protein ACJ761_11950 [Chloroflexota bacterium]
MPLWRCPHCGTPQAESSRCWVCRRSSTACGTCRHFRSSVAAQIGYCGLDPRRGPLRGDEIRGCWEGLPDTAAPSKTPTRPDPGAPANARPRLEFVPVNPAQVRPPLGRRRQASSKPTESAVQPAVTPEPGWNLWGDPEP